MDRWHDPGLETRGIRPLREHRGLVARFVYETIGREIRVKMRELIVGSGTGRPRGIMAVLEDGDDEV